MDSIRVKICLLNYLRSYPDVVIACIEHKVSLEAFRAIEAVGEARYTGRIILGG